MDHDSAGDLIGSDLAARLERWAAEARVEDAARQRVRERWLRQQAEEEATLAGVLNDLAERAVTASVVTRAGRRHHGAIGVVAEDFLALESPTGELVVVALDAVASVRVEAGRAPTGDRTISTELRLAEVLAGLAAERERVVIASGRGDDMVAGSLRSVGQDVAVVRLDGPEGATAYVPLGAVTEVILP